MNHIHWEDLSWIENFVPRLYLLSNNPMDTKGWGYLWGGAPPKLKSIHLGRKEGMKGGREERRK